MRIFLSLSIFILIFSISPSLRSADAAVWPELPAKNASVMIPAQEWPFKPGPRQVRIKIHYPGKGLESVNENTGVMLTLHNWGGVDCVGTPDPRVLSKHLNVVAICVNYLQSGPTDLVNKPEPYDFGYLQSLDALRALWFVFDGLQQKGIPFAENRIFACGGSGGGNVTLMANKLAPRTFACVVDLSGMAKLSDDIAFHEKGGSRLNARWSNDPKNDYYLSPAAQEIRFIGNPTHLSIMKKLGGQNGNGRITVVHGADDNTCTFADVQEMVKNFSEAGLDVHPNFISKEKIDDKVFRNTGHSIGNRTNILMHIARQWLTPNGPDSLVRKGKTDFEYRDEAVTYPVTGGRFVISYKEGYPIGRFVAE